MSNANERREARFDIARWLLVFAALPCMLDAAFAAESRCFGSTSHGRIEGAQRLPLAGENFVAYSTIGWGLGRTFVHGKVRSSLLQAFEQLQRGSPATMFVYGETGRESGGRFAPHKTHQNGLSVDIMVPVLRDGTSVPLPGGMLDRYGYDIEFDRDGRYDDVVIDFEALGELLYRIERAASANGIGIARVIFDVPLQQHLWRTARGPYLRKHVTFSSKAAWVRHDEHVHIDFAVRCAAMTSD